MAATVTYMDHAATTPMRQSAIDAMMPFLDGVYANPSGSHRFARLARKSVDEARDLIASIVGCKPGEVVFTGCGTESDNAAIVGVVVPLTLRRFAIDPALDGEIGCMVNGAGLAMATM
ncbi:MAG: aminotransferase class V-fold PLP-dependent enzyme, partial [Acidimicrobiia bacterium]|nr:aminotransferase class V-fold PLP-dependent enzyme [Acidimicrobiia bacterium]